MFCVIKHPDVAVPGTCSDEALEGLRHRGWFRVSDWSPAPTDFHLPDFADAAVDLDVSDEPAEQADEPEPKANQAPESDAEQPSRPSRTTKESK